MLQTTETEYCKMDVHYIADIEKVKEKRQEAVSLLRDTTIPGYRPGKAPDFAIRIQMKKQIDEWMKQELVSMAYDDILYETKIKPIGYPQVQRAELHDNDFFCDLTFMKKPDFELKQYKDLEIPRPHPAFVAVEEAQRTLQEVRMQFGSVAAYGENDFTQLGDKITCDYTTTENNEPVSQFTQEGALYQIGDKLLPGFDDEILGMSPGEERSFPLEVEGKRYQVKVLLHMGMKRTPAELNDELGQKAGAKDLNELMGTLENYYIQELKQRERNGIVQQLVRKLLDQHQFQVPSWLVSMEFQSLLQQLNKKAEELSEAQKEQYLQAASDNCRWSMILDSVQEAEPECVFSDQEIMTVLSNRLLQSGKSETEVKDMLLTGQKDGSLFGMVANLKNEAVIEFLVSKIKIID